MCSLLEARDVLINDDYGGEEQRNNSRKKKTRKKNGLITMKHNAAKGSAGLENRYSLE